jgi:hypothetical protein
MDHHVVTNIDAHMGNALHIGSHGLFKKHQITGHYFLTGDVRAQGIEALRSKTPGLKNAGLIEDPADKAGAIEAGLGTGTAVHIGIIDAKYYTHTMQTQYDAHTLHSANLYQIFTYVKNRDMEFGGQPHEVSGMLLYAKTDEMIQPDNIYQMSGNQISVKTLDLNQEFSEIAKQLNAIVSKHFGAE